MCLHKAAIESTYRKLVFCNMHSSYFKGKILGQLKVKFWVNKLILGEKFNTFTSLKPKLLPRQFSLTLKVKSAQHSQFNLFVFLDENRLMTRSRLDETPMTPYGLKHFEKNSHGNDEHELIQPKYEAAHV